MQTISFKNSNWKNGLSYHLFSPWFFPQHFLQSLLPASSGKNFGIGKLAPSSILMQVQFSENSSCCKSHPFSWLTPQSLQALAIEAYRPHIQLLIQLQSGDSKQLSENGCSVCISYKMRQAKPLRVNLERKEDVSNDCNGIPMSWWTNNRCGLFLKLSLQSGILHQFRVFKVTKRSNGGLIYFMCTLGTQEYIFYLAIQ